MYPHSDSFKDNEFLQAEVISGIMEAKVRAKVKSLAKELKITDLNIDAEELMALVKSTFHELVVLGNPSVIVDRKWIWAAIRNDEDYAFLFEE